MDFSKVPIEDDFNECHKYSSVVERYFTPRYCLGVSEAGDDYCVLIHSNRVCVVTLAPSHKILRQAGLAAVDFQVSGGLNRLHNRVSGKWKHGAQRLQPHSPLMRALASDGTSFTLRSPIVGKLIEVNHLLSENPQLLLSEPQGRGHLAIVFSEIPVVEQYRDSFLNEEQYKTKCDELQKEQPTSII